MIEIIENLLYDWFLELYPTYSYSEIKTLVDTNKYRFNGIIEEYQNEINFDLENTIKNLEREVDDLTDANDDLESDVDILTDSNRDLKREVVQLEYKIEELESTIEELQC